MGGGGNSFVNRPLLGPFFLTFYIVNNCKHKNVLRIKMAMTGFEHGSSGIRSVCSTNSATTTALILVNLYYKIVSLYSVMCTLGYI